MVLKRVDYVWTVDNWLSTTKQVTAGLGDCSMLKYQDETVIATCEISFWCPYSRRRSSVIHDKVLWGPSYY